MAQADDNTQDLPFDPGEPLLLGGADEMAPEGRIISAAHCHYVAARCAYDAIARSGHQAALAGVPEDLILAAEQRAADDDAAEYEEGPEDADQ